LQNNKKRTEKTVQIILISKESSQESTLPILSAKTKERKISIDI
jgi:hypothetical protein